MTARSMTPSSVTLTKSLTNDPHAADGLLEEELWRSVVPEENSSVVVAELFLCGQPESVPNNRKLYSKDCTHSF
jgi:hypothetical protein